MKSDQNCISNNRQLRKLTIYAILYIHVVTKLPLKIKTHWRNSLLLKSEFHSRILRSLVKPIFGKFKCFSGLPDNIPRKKCISRVIDISSRILQSFVSKNGVVKV